MGSGFLYSEDRCIFSKVKQEKIPLFAATVFQFVHFIVCNPVIDKVSRPRAGRAGYWIPDGVRHFLFSKTSRMPLEPTQNISHCSHGIFFRGVKRPRREARYSTPLTPNWSMSGEILPLSLYDFMACRRNNLYIKKIYPILIKLSLINPSIKSAAKYINLNKAKYCSFWTLTCINSTRSPSQWSRSLRYLDLPSFVARTRRSPAQIQLVIWICFCLISLLFCPVYDEFPGSIDSSVRESWSQGRHPPVEL